MRLETKYAEQIISMLEDAQDVGLPHVVFELRPMEMDLQPHQLNLFETIGEALDYLDDASGHNYLPGDADHPIYYRPADRLLEEIKQANSLTINNIAMNLNNLENLKEEMKRLGFKGQLVEQMEDHMKKGVPDFKLHDSIAATKGQVDLTLHFKQSNQSEYYYFNKFEAAHNQAKPLEEGQKYMVISPNPKEPGRNIVNSKFGNVAEAIDFFKQQTGNSELAVGKDAKSKTQLASMENGKINYVNKDFNRTFYAKPVNQTFWIEQGKGFSSEQAANLVQGRSVYRDDMMNLGGEPYKAWVKLDFDKGKDRFGNFSLNQYHDPSYGFHLDAVLDKFNIKEMNDPAKKVLLEADLRNGNRPLITVEKEGQPLKVFVEAVPRYSQLNMYREDGKPEKREQFLKEPAQSQSQSKAKTNEPELAESQGVRR